MVRATILSIIAALATYPAVAADGASATMDFQALNALRYDDMPAAIAKLSKNQKKQLIKAIKKTNADFSMLVDYWGLLVHLGDETTIRRLGQILLQEDVPGHSNIAQGILCSAPTPATIGAFTPIIFTPKEGPNYNSLGVLMMIEESKGFSPELYEWAKQVLAVNYMGSGLFVGDLMRDWWLENAKCFEKKDYLGVKPGRLPPPKDSFKLYVDEHGYHAKMLQPIPGWGAIIPVEPRAQIVN